MLDTLVERRTYKSVSKAGIDQSLPSMKLYHKAKKLAWDPAAIDLDQDKKDWARMTPEEQEYLVNLVAQFDAGEECVTHEILPLMYTMAKEGRLEDEMYLTSFAHEEAKHIEFFRRWLDEVAVVNEDLHDRFQPAYCRVIMGELPKAMERLWTDRSPEAQMEAAVTYNMMIEGVIAETGYHSFYEVLDTHKILPGLRKGVGLIQRDEARHIGYGVYLIARLVSEDPSLFPKVQEKMNELYVYTQDLLEEGAQRYDGQEIPFGLERDSSSEYAMSRFQGRMNVIERSRQKSQSEVNELDYELVGSVQGSRA